MKIKSKRELWDRCLKMKTSILDKAEKTKKTYFGMCYCGVYEYVVPIICDDIVIGVIYAGEFHSDQEKAYSRIKAISEEYNMNQAQLLTLYNSSTQDTIYSPDEITSRLGIVADYLASLYTTLIPLHKNLSKNNLDTYSSEHYILSHAIEFIEQNYSSELNLQKISNFCHCSTSHLSHIFKKNMKVNVKAYINKVRIEHAKLLLKNTHHNISEIAISIGFNDPNYFSNTFKEICGMTPSQYRKTYKQ
ncbi:helix-turn-helix domain-containing protein [Vallitalea okinawensis]|uniref:helix-turn-helix domain-containing protein n=1 Tax=Vallitalea okinawensis TaxID=2078660 RepID=UPI000CFD747C